MSYVIEVPIEVKRLAADAFDKKQVVDMLAQMNIPNDPAEAKKQFIAYEGAKYAYAMAIKELENMRTK